MLNFRQIKQTALAIKSTEQGLKMFSLRIPHHQIQREEFIPITTCMRCYKIEQHLTKDCPQPKTFAICYECRVEGHRFTTCSAQAKCVNCWEGHRTLAYKCLERRRAVVTAKEAKKTRQPQTYSGATTSASPVPIPSLPAIQVDTITSIFTSMAHAHFQNSINPGSFETELNKVLTANKLPAIKIPEVPDPSQLLPSILLPAPASTSITTTPQPLSPVSAASAREEQVLRDEASVSDAEQPTTLASTPSAPASPASDATPTSQSTSPSPSSTHLVSPAPQVSNIEHRRRDATFTSLTPSHSEQVVNSSPSPLPSPPPSSRRTDPVPHKINKAHNTRNNRQKWNI